MPRNREGPRMAPLLAADSRYIRMMILFAVFACGTLARYSRAQVLSSDATAVAKTATTQTVYEPGDVYLPGSHVYVFVGKTGLGHEHGVVGRIKQGRISLNTTRDAGGLEFEMASFSADSPDARKFVGL